MKIPSPRTRRFRISIAAIVLCAIAIGITWGLRIKRDHGRDLEVAEAASTLKLLAYRGLFTESLIEKFQRRTGIRVILKEAAHPEELWESLEATSVGKEPFDVISLFSFQVPLASQLARIQFLNAGELTNFENISPDFRDLPGESSFRGVAPLLWGLIGFAHAPDLAQPPRSWSEAFKQPRFKGRVGLAASTTEFVRLASLTGSHKDLKKNIDAMRASVSLSPDFLTASPLVAKPGSNSPLLVMANHGEMAFSPFSGDWKFVTPEEKLSLWVLSMALHRDAVHEQHAYTFIDFLLEADQAMDLVKTYRQASTLRTLEGTAIDVRLKPSYLRQIPLQSISLGKDFSRAREVREFLR